MKLIETVEDGMVLVDISYKERNFGSGDKLLEDIIGAFVSFNASNMKVRSIFANDLEITSQLQAFQKITEQIQHLLTIYNQEEKISFIHDFLLPSYKNWKLDIEKQLQKYLTN